MCYNYMKDSYAALGDGKLVLLKKSQIKTNCSEALLQRNAEKTSIDCPEKSLEFTTLVLSPLIKNAMIVCGL